MVVFFSFVFVLFLVCPMSPVSLNCPFLIGKSNNLKEIGWKKVKVPEQDCQNRLRWPTMKKTYHAVRTSPKFNRKLLSLTHKLNKMKSNDDNFPFRYGWGVWEDMCIVTRKQKMIYIGKGRGNLPCSERLTSSVLVVIIMVSL